MTTTPVHSDPEKSAGLHFNEQHEHEGHHHHPHLGSHIQHARERLQHFLHPNGTRIHVVDSPQDEVNLRRRLEHHSKDDEPGFDIYISGSAEHLEALRAAQAHHEERRQQLRTEYQEMYQRFEDVHYELDALSHELDRVTTHGVSLEAHFSKFGYDAHIKTYDDESGHASGTTTPRSMSSSTKSGEAKCEKGYGKPLKLFKVPVVRQYFHKGTLWRSSGAEEVQSFELFVDLLYVGIIAVNGDQTSEDPTAIGLLRFLITFTLSWKVWNDMTLIISWFETDDLFQRVSILILMAMLFGYTTNITESFDGTWATLVSFYVGARLYLAGYLFLSSFLVPMIRNVLYWHISIALASAALCISSIFVGFDDRQTLIWIAMAVDLCGQVIFVFIRYSEKIFGEGIKRFMDRAFEFWPAVNIEHRTERMNAFVGLVFGYSVVSMLYQSTVNGIDAHYGKAVLGLTQAFCFNWLYFEVDSSNLHTHAIRRHRLSAFAWTFSHLPFIMAFVLGSGGLSKLVLALDTPDSREHALTFAYREKADDHVPQGIRWFYCAGYAIALSFMGLISITHVHRDWATLRISKKYRLAGRFAMSIVMVFLPLAKSLNSLQLVGIMTALIVFVLGLELWFASCNKNKMFQRNDTCKYFGHCSKKDLVALVKEGKAVDVSQLAAGNKGRTNSGTIAICG